MKIRTKVILYTSALVFVVAATIAFGVIRSLKANLLDEFEKDSIQTHSLIAASLVDPLYNLHIGQLQSISRNARIHPNILEIIVLDDSGYILSDGSEENDLLDEEFTNTFSQKVYEEKKTLSELTEKQLQVGSPVYLNNTDLKGYLFITYDISEIKETINESTQSIIELSLACLLVGIILSLFLSQQLISPIKRLARIAADIGCGNLQVQVKHESGELGILSKTLEEMAQSLQASMVSKDSLHSIIDNIPEMIFVLDNDFHITKINSVTQLKLDIPAAQIIGLSIQVIIPGLPLDSKAQQNTDSTITFNGKKIAILFSSTKIASMGYVCAAVDIALQKETEGALKTAIEVANLANNAKSSFLANMSHEIRTPLNAMIGYTDLLLEDELSGEQREMIKVVKQSSDSLLVLINDILDISKIEAGELILESAPVNLIDCIFEICEIQRAKMYNKNLDLNIDTTKLEHPFVYADKTRIKQVFLNLVSNAIKFTSEGEIIIRAEPVEESEHKIDISFTVADTGIGMSFEQSKHIFDAFKQADSSTTRKYGGTGLGLNITKNIIELMKSDITVNSQQVHGCTFSFTIQFKKDLRAQAPKTEFKDNMADGKTVFILEKTPTAEQTLLYQMLEIRASVRICRDQDEFYLALKTSSPDYIFANNACLTNPAVFIKKIKELHFKGRCFALTSDISNNNLSKINDSGFDSCLLKPVRSEKVYRAMQQMEKHTSLSVKVSDIPRNASVHILVVDDNKMNQILAKKILIKMGHTVELAGDGQQAIDRVKNKQFDLILMDMQMPVLDGPDATIAIRQLDVTTPIIALTANAFEADRLTCINAGMNDYLTKPINRDKLSLLIQKYCS